MSGKLGASVNKMVYPEDVAYVVDKQRDLCRSTFCYRDYVCQVSRLRDMYVIGLILLSALETTKQIKLYQKFKSKILKHITLIWMDFPGAHFYPLSCNETTSLKTIPSLELAYISCILYIRLLLSLF